MKKEIVIFLRQFATLLNAGVPIIQACETLEHGQVKHDMRVLIFAIKRDLQAGHRLFYCMQRHPLIFDDITCHMVNLGEQTGRLAALLNTVAGYQENRQQQQRRIKQAMLYPVFVLAVALCVTLSLLLFVVPRFAELFSAAQVPLPLITRIFFGLSDFLQRRGLLLLLIPPSLYLLKKYQPGRFSLPLLKPILWKIFLAKFSRALSLSLGEGLPLHSALPFAAAASGGRHFSARLHLLRARLAAGHQLHQAMQANTGFPLIMIQMVKVGEETAKLPAMLAKSAEFFETEIDQYLHQVSTIFEPLIILLLGVVIGGLVISMYLPIFKLGSTI